MTMKDPVISCKDKHPSAEYSDISSCSGMEDNDTDKSIAKGGVTTPFPWKLHDMLDAMDKEGDLSVVCWQPHGRAFMVHKPKDFVEAIMPHYFNQTKYASFQRQLNLYGFSRLSHGRDKGAYFHSCFVRGERQLCRGMIRQKIKGTKVRRSLSPEEEPNFYSPEYNTSKKTLVDSTSKSSCSVKDQASPVAPKSLHVSTQALTSPTTSLAPQPPNEKHYRRVSTTGSSLVSLMTDSTSGSCMPVMLPPPPCLNKSRIPSPQQHPSAPHAGQPPQHIQHPPSAKGGDLLYFEGLPFRYLEHIEELPSTQPAHPKPQYHPVPYQQRETLHDMISSIVGMGSSWDDTTTNNRNNMCPV